MNNIHNIGYKLVKNFSPTAETAPYTALPVPVGSLAFDNILTRMLDAGTFMTKATALYLLKAFYEYAAEEIGENVVRISTGTVTLYPAISGAFPSEDAAFDATKNALYVGASLSQAIRDQMAGVAPTYLGDDTAAGSAVRLSSVMDLASQTLGVIDGTNAFRLAGVNLTVPDGADESLALYTKDLATKVCDIAVSANDGGLYLTCALPATQAVAKGAYRIRLASHGLDPTAPLAIVTCPVTLVGAVAPTPTTPTIAKVTQEGQPDDTARLAAVSPCVIRGTGLQLGADDKVLIELWRDGTCLDEGDLSAHDKVVSSGDTEISLSGFQWNNRSVPDGEWWDAYPDTKIVVVKNNVRYEHPMTFKGE